MQSLLERISALEAEIEELKSGVQNKLSADKVTQATSVTEPGWAADARQMNPSVTGSLANEVSGIKASVWKANEYGKFADIPLPYYSYSFSVVSYNGADADAPNKSSAPWWWNVITFGINSRATQLAFCPYRDREQIFVRQNHDGTWFKWCVLFGQVVN